MADEVPVSQVLCEATEYLTKLGSNLRLRSQNLKEKRISREKLRNTHAVQKAANKVLLICELSKKSLENVENGIRKVLSIISSSQALSVIGGKPEKFEEIDESKFHFFEYESFKLRVSKKVPFKHYTSVKVLASRMPESMQNKYPVYHRCKLYKLRRAERKSIENKAKLDSKDEDYNRLRSSSVDKRVTKTGITYEDLKSSTKDSENHISQSDEEGFKGFSHESTDQGNLMIDRGNLRADKGTKSRSSSPDKIQSKDFGNMYDDSRKQNDETKTKKFRRVQLIDDDVSSSSKEDLVSNTTMDSKSKERNNENTKSDPEDSNKRKLSEHGSEKSGEEETASNHKSKKLKNQNDVQSKSDCRDSDVSENKSKEVKCHESEQRSQQSVELNEVSLNKDDEIYSDSNNERNKPLIKCVSISKLLKPDIVPNYKQSKDKPNNKSKDRTKSTGKSKIFDHKTSQFDEADSEYWDKKRAEVKKFRPKKFSIYISRLPQLTVSFLCSHSLKRITKNDSIICEISKETSPISDNSEKNNYNEIATVNLVGSQDIVPVECTNLNDIKNALLDDSDTENADSIDHNKITENAKVVTESLLAKSDFDKNDKLISSAVVDSENDQPLETGQVKDLQNNKADHTKEIEVEISCARHDNENTDTESTPKKGYVNKTTECDENSPKYNDSITPNGKQISITESMDAKKKLLQTYSSDSDADDKQLKSKIEDIKNSLLNTVSSSDDEKVKKKSSDDSPRKKLLASSGSEDEEVNIQKQKKRLKIKKKRKSKFYDSDKDSSSIEQMDGSVDSKSMKQKKKMGRSKAKPGSSSHSSDTRDDNDVKGLTNLNSLRKTHRRRDSSSTNSSTSENMKSTRSARNMPSAPKIKDDNILAMESSSDAVDDDNGDVEDLPPVSLSGLNGGAIEHLAKDDLLNESDSSSLADKEKSSDDNKKDETIDSDEETSVKLKRRKGQTISSDSEVGSSRKKDRGVKLSDFEDSEDESSEYSKKSKRRKKPGSESDASGGSSDIGTKKRRRIKQVDDSDMSGSDTENEGKNKHGRKNIRKVMGKNQLEEATKKAARQEKERIARIAERQKLYNNMQFDESGKPDEVVLEKVVLDFDPETKEPLIEVDRGLVKKLKPHQANGIKFMWDACFESVKRIKKDKGSGCILAHCMGLGKTLQVVSLTHTLLTLPELTGVNRVLVVCPLSTVLNWVNEFNMWLKYAVRDTDVHVYELSRFKQNSERAYQLTQWFNNGGVCVLGYEMFRNLSADNTKKYKKKMLRQFQESLVDPGPDLVVCDEGHLLKNEKTSLSQSMNKVKTLRRIVLTGTPLQNNLKEYYCMVQFVKPNLLGKYNEYLNRFVNPITNGQYTDSTEHDIRIMKRRSHVLHKMLDGAVQRRDYGVLAPFLPPKHEYVLFITLTEVQVKLYQFYLDNYSRRPLAGKSSGFLFPDFQSLQRIWTHPLVLKYNSERYEIMQQKKRDKEEEDSEGSLVDFIDDDSTPDESTSDESSDDLSDMSDDSRKKSKKKKAAKKSKAKESKVSTRRGTRANPAEILDDDTPEVLEVKNENPTEWWIKMVTDDVLEDMRNSSKLVLLFDILRQCETIGDKLLVFSQSLYSLDLIEHFLGKVDEATQEGRDDPKLGGHRGSWSPGVDYFRLDGSTSCENRSIWCKNFNREDNPRARLFLISTRAGGLGINLVAANRVVIFDVSWNPSHDVQSIFRVYRFGQKKPCYVYRFLAMMAPMRGERGGSPARAARASLPLPRRLIRQIARHVASSGRSLRRLEVSGRVIDNFDDLDNGSDESDMDMEVPQPAVACGGNAGNLPPTDNDDDLTSLSWLQDRNLLRGINLTKGDAEDAKMIGSQVVIKTETSKTPPPVARLPSPPPTPCKSPPSPPTVTHTKPPYSFSCLIFMAIEAAPTRALPVKEIYAWITHHFPYFKHAPQGWKNSVRHNLSLNKCFHKVAAAPGLGKGSLWTVDPQHRASLIQAFGRQPIPPAPPESPKNTPDPQLFPFLARRLAGDAPKSEPGADEYLAAATVLAMKYGPAVLDQLPPAAHLVISRCARDEHSYSGSCEERRTAEALLNLAGVKSEPAPS